eukprot:TRINITY_DN11721_c0_g1_i1.p1 TRINITY_DN11721_c0_g1~~TRINITY_DN11721_c0_g1_i1.p1  ORF type:complete len:316 (+),score=36.88 TRINITY_DN11721_c0_g1_i1:93-950(+)
MATSSEESINWKKYHFQEYLYYFLSLIQGSKGSYKHNSHGAHLLFTGDDMWNSILLFSMNHDLCENLPDELQNWLHFFYRHGSDHADIYFPADIDFKKDLVSELEQRDFTFWSKTYGMELDLTQQIDWLVADGSVDSEPTLRIHKVDLTDREKMDHFHSIVAENFLYGDEESYRSSFIKMRRQASEEPHMIYFIGYFNGSPVTTVSLSLRHSYLGIVQLSDVSTLVHFRRKGFARIMMQHACREAKRIGSKWVALQGERDAPMQLYQSLGFRASCEFEVWENMGS